MTHTPHELAAEFPGHAERIHLLKLADPHFHRLYDEYHEANRAVHRAETRVDAISEPAEAALRRRRLVLKDQLARMIDGVRAPL